MVCMAKAPKDTQSTKNTIEPDVLPSRQSKRARVRKHVKTRYDTYMLNRKRHRIIVWVVFFVCSLTVAAQLLYPPDRALPLTRIMGERVAWQGHDQLAELLDTGFRQTNLKLVVGDDA